MSPEQRLLNEAVAHIRKQGGPAYDGVTCSYRSQDGKRCAFAPAIEKYTSTMEGARAKDLLYRYSDQLYEWARYLDADFSMKLQRCHDRSAKLYAGSEFLQRFETEVKILAKEYDLKFPEGGGFSSPSIDT